MSKSYFAGMQTGKIARVKAERLVTKDPDLPDDLVKLAIRIIKRLEPYEPYSGVINWSNQREVVDMFTLLVLEGVFDDDLMADIRRLGRRMYEYEERMHRLVELGKFSTPAFLRWKSRFEIALQSRHRAIMDDGRRLAAMCIDQSGGAARMLAIRLGWRFRGAAGAIEAGAADQFIAGSKAGSSGSAERSHRHSGDAAASACFRPIGIDGLQEADQASTGGLSSGLAVLAADHGRAQPLWGHDRSHNQPPKAHPR